MTTSIKAAFSIVVLSGLVGGQTVTHADLTRGVYSDAGLVAADEVTLVVQTLGADGFRGSFDDAVAILRDIGGQWEIVHVTVGVMTAGLIAIGGGKVATVSSGVDGQIGTLDDSLVVIHNCSVGIPYKQNIPFGGTFVGGAALAQHVRTEDLISRVGEMKVAAVLAGPTATPALPTSDAVAFVELASGSPSVSHVDSGTWLHRSPPSPMTLPGDAHEVLAVFGRGADQQPSTEDDLFVIVERTGAGPWGTRSVEARGGLVNGWRRRAKRFDANHAVAVLATPESGQLMGYDPPSSLTPPDRVTVAFMTVTGVHNPMDMLQASFHHLSEGSRWIPPSPAVRYVSAFVCTRTTSPHQLVEFTDFEEPEPTPTWHPWLRGWSNDPVIGFYGQSTPVATGSDNAIATTDPQVGSSGGWVHAGIWQEVSETIVLNDGVVVQLSDTALGYVENVTAGGTLASIPNPPGLVLPRTLVRLSGGSVASLSAGFDAIVGNADDGIMVWTGLPGVTVLGHGHPERPDGGPRLRVADALYPSAGSSAVMTVTRDQAGPGAPGSWRWGFVMLSAQSGFNELGWGRAFLAYAGLWQLSVLDPFAGVGSTGAGVSHIALPSNAGLAGVEAALQWIVHNPQSPWDYDTSNGLQVRFGL